MTASGLLEWTGKFYRHNLRASQSTAVRLGRQTTQWGRYFTWCRRQWPSEVSGRGLWGFACTCLYCEDFKLNTGFMAACEQNYFGLTSTHCPCPCSLMLLIQNFIFIFLSFITCCACDLLDLCLAAHGESSLLSLQLCHLPPVALLSTLLTFCVCAFLLGSTTLRRYDETT